jgi:pilus assembly protein FimV
LAPAERPQRRPRQPLRPPRRRPSAPGGCADSAPEVAQTAPPPAEAAPPPAPSAPAACQPQHRLPPRFSQVRRLLRYWWIAALIVAAILARIGFSAYRSRQEVNFDDSLGRLASAGADTMNRDSLGDTAKMRAARDPTFVVEEGARARTPARTRPDGCDAPRASIEDTRSNETAINLDQGDPLAEADFHMAYGLYDQAADLVRIAIAREPERRDLKLKLLEVFFVWGNKEQFLQSAHELAATREQAVPGEWEKIVIMGKQLAPEDPLFGSGTLVSGAAAGGIDLDLEGGESRIDFDLLGEPVPDEDAAAGLDLDIGSALGTPDTSGEQTTRAPMPTSPCTDSSSARMQAPRPRGR